jgi:hypothetical protein
MQLRLTILIKNLAEAVRLKAKVSDQAYGNELPTNSPVSQPESCDSPSGCIEPNPNPPSLSNQGPDWLRFGIVSSFGYFASVGPYYITGSVDLVISAESGQAVILQTAVDRSYQCKGGILCSGDFTTPQVSVIDPKLGILSNLDKATDYMGSFHDQVVTMANITVEQIQSDRVSGILLGTSLGIPSWGYSDTHTYSNPWWFIR